ncbi:MAG: methane monooxygenase, partial [Anaerolineae bacterium]|nr:methane monooxygenase [Anaerolineae bacterium]
VEQGYIYPHRCWSCMVPCLIHEDFQYGEVDGKVYTYCSELCKWTHINAFAGEYEGRPTPAMGRFSGKREWETVYHGWTLDKALVDLGFVRNDGKTLMPQPHLHMDDSKMWKLEHVKDLPVNSPLEGFRALSAKEREAAAAKYREGYKIRPI